MFYQDRQEKFPEEFRIESNDWDYQSILDTINEEPENEETVDLEIFKDIILRIWRASNKAESYQSKNNAKRAESLVRMNDEFDENESKFVINAIKNSLNPIKFMGKQTKSVLNILKENGFEIKDHTNSKYYDGMALKVLVFETSDEVEESIITETIKPSIYYKDELILNGEVVVTTPANENN